MPTSPSAAPPSSTPPTAATAAVPTAAAQVDASRLTGHQRSLIALAVVANVAEFFDVFLIGFIVSLLAESPGWDLSGRATGIILAGAGLGTVLGAVVWGRVADAVGRRRAFAWCVTALVVFTAASALTPTNGWVILALLRTGVGFGVGGLITSVPFVQEFVPAKQRGLLSGLTSVFIPAGIFLGGLATRYLGDPLGWRGLVALGCVPVVLLLWIRVVPESPRYLQTHGRVEEARAAYAWALELPVDEVAPLPAVASTPRVSYGELLRDHARPLAIVAVGAFCFTLGSFTIQSWGQTLLGQSFGVATGAVAGLFMLVSLGDLLGRLGVAWASDRVGRRAVLLVCGALGAVGCLIAAYSAHVAAEGAGGSDLHRAAMTFFVGVLITMVFGDGAFGILSTFSGEQFPNEVRSTGLGLGWGIGASAKVVGPYLVGALIGSGQPTPEVVRLPFLIFAGLLLLGGLTFLLAHETKGEALESI